MIDTDGNTKQVFVVQADSNKDLSDARRYGNLRAVFMNSYKPYDTNFLIKRARRVLKEWRPGDHLLMLGDPTLCAVAMTVLSEKDDVINVLSWDRERFQYIPQRWDFNPDMGPDDSEFPDN
jgi:hypothetical protein